MIGSVYPASVLQNCKRLLLPCKKTLGLSSEMAPQPSGAAFERPWDSGVEESKSFDPPDASPAQPRVSLGAMPLNKPARPRRRSAEQRSPESTRKIARYREQSRSGNRRGAVAGRKGSCPAADSRTGGMEQPTSAATSRAIGGARSL